MINFILVRVLNHIFQVSKLSKLPRAGASKMKLILVSPKKHSHLSKMAPNTDHVASGQLVN